MRNTVIGLLHPGEMGAAVGGVLTTLGYEVLWASHGRSEQTVERAKAVGLTDVGTVTVLAERSDMTLSVVPPHGALDTARSVAGKAKLFVDANAVSPETSRTIGAELARAGTEFVDGGIVGPPPRRRGTTRLYLSGPRAGEVAGLFGGGTLDTRVLPGDLVAASALKMCYAAWTKGTDALLIAILAVASAHEVDGALVDEWGLSQAALVDRRHRAGWTASRKGWRWIAEMEEIAATFASAGLPGGFHQAAAEIFRAVPRDDGAEQDEETLQRVLALLRGSAS